MVELRHGWRSSTRWFYAIGYPIGPYGRPMSKALWWHNLRKTLPRLAYFIAEGAVVNTYPTS